jgi:hypothetical protein
VPYLLNTFASNVTVLIQKSKSSTTTTNLTFFITTSTIVFKKLKIYQNEFGNKQMKWHLAKLKVAKAHTWQNIHL